MKHDPDPISPLYEKWFPHLTQEEKMEATENFRGFLKVLYDVYCRMEKDGRLDEMLHDGSDESSTPLGVERI